MAKLKVTLPNVHFGKAHNKPMDWEHMESEDDAGDDELDVTPADVTGMLGFDPKKIRTVKKTKTKGKTK